MDANIKPSSQASGNLSTYEDCIALIDSVSSSTEPSTMQAALGKLKAFLVTRLARKAADKERDGGNAVKRAVETSRTFKPYEPKEIPDAKAPSPWG
jgi:hypothetical protein